MPRKDRGEFTLYIGNMASGKTGHLILEIETLGKFGKKNILVFKPKIDTRSGKNRISSRRGSALEALEISPNHPEEILKTVKEAEDRGERVDILAVDEIQFFPQDSGLFWLIKRLLGEGYDVIAAGLALDFRGEPFGSTLWLAVLAQGRCVWLNSCCTECGKPAIFPQRFLPSGELAPYNDPDVVVGSEDKGNENKPKQYYEARCGECFIVPPRKGE